jgi:hypothetical protein
VARGYRGRHTRGPSPGRAAAATVGRHLRRRRRPTARRLVLTLACVAVLAGAPAMLPGATATSVTSSFTPSDDADVSQRQPTRNFGSTPTLRTKRFPKVERSYLRFDATGLTGPVTAASLRLYAEMASPAGYTVRTVAPTEWTERTITYANAPAPGAVVVTSGPVAADSWTSVDVTSLVPREGVVNLVLTGSGRSAGLYASRETAATAPRLVVTTSTTAATTTTRATTTTAATTTTTRATSTTAATTTTKPPTTTGGPLPPPSGAHYVSRLGPSNGNGSSWANAWPELASINWSSVAPGDTIFIDGGSSSCGSNIDPLATPRPGVSCGMEYKTTLTVGASGTAGNPIHIERSTEAGRNGSVVLFGGRNLALPHCHQRSYSAPTGAASLINLNGKTQVIIDGKTRSGILGYGARQGVVFGSDMASFITLRNLEVYDNGIPTTISGGYNSDGENVEVRGHHHTFERMLVHDGGQDDFQSANVGTGTLHDLTWRDSWIYFKRENPTAPGFSFNEPQSSGCTHADGIQLYAGGRQSGLTLDHVVFGPGGNQYFYPSDGNTTRFDNVSVRHVLFPAAHGHNFITDSAVHNWTLDHVTMYAPRGGSELPSDGPITFSNSIKLDGYWFVAAGSGNWTSASSVWFGGDSVPGGATNTNRLFLGPLPSSSPPSFSQLLAMDFTPTCEVCSGKGAGFARITDILTRIDTLN